MAQPPGLSTFFEEDAKPVVSPVAPAARPARGAALDPSLLDGVASSEGLSQVQRQVFGALLGQESSGGRDQRTSIDGARGAGQILPATFQQYAKPGERIDDQGHNLAVMARIVKDLGAKSGDDPARIATGYFSGPGNINRGEGSAWRDDRADGNGKRVSSYVNDIIGRLAGATPAKAAEPAKAALKPGTDLAGAPKWSVIVAKPEYKAMSPEDRKGAQDAYFNTFIAPTLAPDQQQTYRGWFATEAAKHEPDSGRGVGGVLQDVGAQLGKGVNTMLGAVPNLIDPTSSVSKFFNDNAEYWDQQQTSQTQQQVVLAEARIRQAAKAGLWEETKAAVAEYATNPVLAQKFIVETLPSMVPGLGAAKAAHLAALARGATATRAATVAAGAAGATNAAMNGGGARQGAYQELSTLPAEAWATDQEYAAMRRAGQSHEQAASARAKALSVVPAAVGAAAGAVSGASGLESLVTGGARAGAKAAARRVATEAGGEQLEELAPQLATNVQAQGLDQTRTLTQGLGQTAVQTAIGAGPGSVAAAFGGSAAPAEPVQPAATPEPASARVEPTLGTPPAPQTAPQPATAEKPVVADQDVLDYADQRYRELRAARDGETLQQFDEDGAAIESEQVPRGLTPADTEELAGLEAHRGNPRALAKLYGFDRQPAATPVEQRERATADYKDAAQSGDEAGAQEAMEAMAEAREAINAAQAKVAADVQGQLEQAAKPKTEKQAKEQRANKKESGNAVPATTKNGRTGADHVALPESGADVDAAQSSVQGTVPAMDAASGAAALSAPKTEKEAAARRAEWETNPYFGHKFADRALADAFMTKKKADPALFEAQETAPGRFEIKPKVAAAIDAAANEAATSPLNDLQEPTEGQKDAGNYRKGHLNLHGLSIAIENPAGSVRSGVDKSGKPWSNTLANHYGYLKSTTGADGDHVDTFIGPDVESGRVFVVDQTDPASGKFDEHKVIFGASSLDEARAIYEANYEKGWQGGKGISETSVEGFKTWLKDGDTTKPYAPQATKESNDRTNDVPAATRATEPDDGAGAGGRPDPAGTAADAGTTAQPAAVPDSDVSVRPDVQEAEEKAPLDDWTDIPKAFIRKQRVSAQVFNEETGAVETGEVPADQALAAVRDEIADLKALIQCMKG